MDENSTQALKILNYWHKIEFFNSADMRDITKLGKGAIHYDIEELLANSACLPWMNRNQIRRAGRKYMPDKHYTYKVYIGLFHRAEIFDAGKHFFRSFELENPESSERNQDSGYTCSIILHLDIFGNIQLEKTEISTAPWAIGKLQQGLLSTLKLDDFDNDSEKLNKHLEEVCIVANNLKEEGQYPKVLTTYELAEFLKLVSKWSQFHPSSEKILPCVTIQLNEITYKKGQVKPKLPNLSSLALPDFSSLKSRLKAKVNDNNTQCDDDVEVSSNSQPISILNSFYIRDIELVMEQLRKGKIDPHSALATYLGQTPQRESDLLSKKGQSLIRKHLSLNMTPAGRWPGEDEHSMSLMQQFAINTLYKELEEQGVYSVNGPPGTGKTTMLRDIIANNLVERAKVLADFKSIEQSVIKHISVNINNQSVLIPVLNPELTGFEMVVVSSNNTAVENITKELPRLKSLGSRYQKIEYFKPAAQKLAAIHDFKVSGDKQPKLHALSKNSDCWGLMAAAIGNQKNRNAIGDKLFFTPTDSMDPEKGAEDYHRLLDAIKSNQNKSKDLKLDFESAQADFNNAEKELDKCLSEINKMSILEDKKRLLDEYYKRLDNLEIRCLRLESFVAKLQRKKMTLTCFLLSSFWKSRAIIKAMTLRLDEYKHSYSLQKRKVELFKQELNKVLIRNKVLCDKYRDIIFDDGITDLEDATLQRKAFAHCEELNIKRANLTVKALELHQTWLIAVTKHYILGSSVLYHMSKALGNSIADKEGCKAIWHWLFMFIPVVSSSFASVSRQFSTFGKGEIGWLFIDEAGQASPQQAVGAMFRAKRAVVVGDPLQIEPVFTIPPEFVEGFARELFEGDEWMTWSPTLTSVQKLADRINPYGTSLISHGEWLGSPLRVHRRCDEPMFSISNKIAYNDKMFHGKQDPKGADHITWGQSSWIDISGEVDGKHYVPKQGVYVAHMIYDHYVLNRQLPDIYVISPFRKVKDGLEQDISRILVENGIKKDEVLSWIDRRIGTVHTFQGKEEKTVIFVLGLSEATKGAANWVSGKPNILNVAISRAQKQVYIVGSKKIWAGLQYFNDTSFLLASGVINEQDKQLEAV